MVGNSRRMLSNSREPLSDEFSVEDERYMAISNGMTSRLSMKNQHANAFTKQADVRLPRTKTPVQHSNLMNQQTKLSTIRKYTNQTVDQRVAVTDQTLYE